MLQNNIEPDVRVICIKGNTARAKTAEIAGSGKKAAGRTFFLYDGGACGRC